MMKRFLSSILILISVGTTCWGANRPNFVWIFSEGNSIHYLRLYGAPHQFELDATNVTAKEPLVQRRLDYLAK